MKDVNGSILYKEKEYKLIFNLNVMEAIQDKYGTLNNWSDLIERDGEEPNIKALKYGFTQMLNEAIDIENEEEGTNIPMFTEKQVGRMLTEIGMSQVAEALKDTIVGSTQSTEKNA